MRVALRCAVLPVTALFVRPERRLAWRLFEVCFGSLRPGLYPEVRLSALVDRDTSVVLSELPAEYFNVNETELLALAAFASFLKPDMAFELGTADGRTTLNIAANMGNAGHVYTLSLPLSEDPTHFQRAPLGHRFAGHSLSPRITQLLGNSASFDFEPYVGSCGLVFVDADHSAEGACRESHIALRLVDRRHGMIVWHDAVRWGVRTTLRRLACKQQLPVHLLAGTNLALLGFCGGGPVSPEILSKVNAAGSGSAMRHGRPAPFARNENS